MTRFLARVLPICLVVLGGCNAPNNSPASDTAISRSQGRNASESPGSITLPTTAVHAAPANSSGLSPSYEWELYCGDGDVTNASKQNPQVAMGPGVSAVDGNYLATGPRLVIGLWAGNASDPVPNAATFLTVGYNTQNFPVSTANNTNVIASLASADSSATQTNIASLLSGAIDDLTAAVPLSYSGSPGSQLFAEALICNLNAGPNGGASSTPAPAPSQLARYYYSDLPQQLLAQAGLVSAAAGGVTLSASITYSSSGFSASVVPVAGLQSQLESMAAELGSAPSPNAVSLTTATTLASAASALQNNQKCDDLGPIWSGIDSKNWANDPLNLGLGIACAILNGMGSQSSFSSLVNAMLVGSGAAMGQLAVRLAAASVWINTPYPSGLLMALPTCLPASGLAIDTILDAAPIPLGLGPNNQIVMSGTETSASFMPEASLASYMLGKQLYFDSTPIRQATYGDINTFFRMFSIGLGASLTAVPAPINPTALAVTLVPGASLQPISDAKQFVFPGVSPVQFHMRSLAMFAAYPTELNPTPTEVANPACTAPTQSGVYCKN
jgi:hypothetical protein